MSNRDEQGRFLPGHSLKSPGRPRREVEQEYLDILNEVVPPERFRRMVERVAKHIEDTGSIRAFEALSNRMLGKPVAVVQHQKSGMDRLHELLDQMPDVIVVPQTQHSIEDESGEQ